MAALRRMPILIRALREEPNGSPRYNEARDYFIKRTATKSLECFLTVVGILQVRNDDVQAAIN